MRLRDTALIILVLCLPAPVRALPAHVWSHRWNDPDDASFYDIAVDPFGNIVTCGDFFSGLTLDTHYVSAGSTDAFVAKFNASGNVVWSRHLGNPSGDDLYALTTDYVGNIIAVGDDSPNNADMDGVVVKYAVDGTQRFLKHYGVGDGKFQTVEAVATDLSKNIFIAGEFDSTIDVGNGPLTKTDDDRTMFLAKLDQLGNAIWSKRFVMTTEEVYYVTRLETDAEGRAVMFGYFNGSIDFGSGPVVSTGARDLFLAEFDPNGNVVWAHAYGGPGNQYPGDMARNESGKIAITAFVDAAVNFGGGLLTPTTPFDPVVAVFNSAGTHQWSRIFNGAGSHFGQGITWAANEDVLVSCIGTGTMNMGGSLLTPTGVGYSVFLGRYTGANGNHRWSTVYSSTGGLRSYVEEDHGKIILGQSVSGDVNFGGGLLTGTGLGDGDPYLAEFTDVLYTGVGDTLVRGALAISSYPNPFNPQTTIRYVVPSRGRVVIAVYDASGARVATLVDAEKAAGSYTEAWDGRDDAGRAVSSGVYFARISHASGSKSEKLVLLK